MNKMLNKPTNTLTFTNLIYESYAICNKTKGRIL